ncbi:hypothetical protein FJT64_023700 [Amphibalanus amphitrite]|uniref:Endonuclease/exonuclease/phosphatase domain-containing protein n=1 Tax=Amphibalanus amphitrite TaxID=1232801 RepID=A0A6A4WER1_AMPAM|nr:hypothetical protein FJT64_023700 [Amphibalanus amphitrite]
MGLNGRRALIVGAIYRPPSAAAVPDIDALRDQLTYVLAKDKPVYALGDTNFDVLRPTKAGVASYVQLLNDLSLSQLITTPTRPGSNATLIDHIITNSPELTTDAEVTPVNISDHDLVTASVRGIKPHQQRRVITVRSTRQLNQDALCLDLLLADWSPVYQAASTTAKWAAWKAVWDPIIDQHMPHTGV